MDLNPLEPIEISLAAGEALTGLRRGVLWRLQSGALRMHEADAAGQTTLIGVALPGDLVGVECLVGEAPTATLRALTAARLQCVSMGSTRDLPVLLTQALMQSRRQCRDNMRLRFGPVAERIKCLLLMLSEPPLAGPHNSAPDMTPCPLPSLRDMAAVVDSAPETVSRVIGSLRRLAVLHDRKPTSVRFNRVDLHELKTLPGMTSSHVSVMRPDGM
jgi:CRP-like cAMP-binding protein